MTVQEIVRVQDMMTRDVITVGPASPIHEAARLMVNYGISGLPVVDDAGAIVGVISEGDLVLRQKRPDRRSWWQLFFVDAERLAREYQKAIGVTVREVMTTAVLTVSPELPLADAAVILDRHRIRRVPVVDKGRLVGILTRGDVIKTLANAPVQPAPRPPDAQLVHEMRERLAREPWATKHGIVVQATDGVISLWGLVVSEAEKAAIESMARGIEGVKAIKSHLTVRTDLPYWYGHL